MPARRMLRPGVDDSVRHPHIRPQPEWRWNLSWDRVGSERDRYPYPYGKRRARRDVVVVMRVGEILLVEHVLDVDLCPDAIVERVEHRRVDTREARQRDRVVSGGVHIALVHQAKAHTPRGRKLVAVPERELVLGELRERRAVQR